MSKILAIKGHPTRGKEVIDLLEMLGGKNIHNLSGNDIYSYYIIKGFKNEICNELHIFGDENMQCFTIEEFLEKFPFKVGDFVRIPEYESEVRILKMKWCPLSEHIEYLVYRNDDEEWYTASELLEYNDNPNEMTDCKKYGLHFGSVRCFDKDCPNNTPKEIDKSVFMVGPVMVPDKVDDKLEYEIVDGYEFDKIENGKIILKPIKFEYPKTYKECCDVLSITPYYNLRYHTFEHGYSEYAATFELCSLQDKLNTLGKVIICYNAYRKIAGEQMGLDGPWKPDWSGFSDGSYPTITKCNDRIVKTSLYTHDCILAFPTEELRDMFYENFKHLIEQVKELL